jgi:hypothetical protein
MKTANQGLEGSAEERSSVPVALRAPAPPQPRRSPSHHAILSALEFTRHTECDLKVTRIVRNIESQDLAQAQRFYGDILGLDLMMDLGWIRTYGSKEMMAVQISLLSEGGSGTPVTK